MSPLLLRWQCKWKWKYVNNIPFALCFFISPLEALSSIIIITLKSIFLAEARDRLCSLLFINSEVYLKERLANWELPSASVCAENTSWRLELVVVDSVCPFPPTAGNSWNNPCDGRDHIASNEGESCTVRLMGTDVPGFLAASTLLELNLCCPAYYGCSKEIVNCQGRMGVKVRASFLENPK